MKYNFLFAFILSLVLLNVISATAQENSKFYIDGQIHPDYSIKIMVNGKLVNEVIPAQDSVKIFVFDLEKGVVKQGENIVGVQYLMIGVHGLQN